MPPAPRLVLIPEELAAHRAGVAGSTIRKWAMAGRIRSYPRAGRANGVAYDYDEIPLADRDEDGRLIAPAPAPPRRTTSRAA